jgi:Zn-dependent peptidase ImmA (M78 family)/DNA-binding XRE family transcriptional regulator
MVNRVVPLNIKRLRNIRGFTQLEVARKSGLSRAAYINIENGKSEPKSSTLLNIAGALEVDIQELFYQPRPVHSLRFRIGKTHTKKDEDIRRYDISKFSHWLTQYEFLENELKSKSDYKLAGIKRGNRNPGQTAEIARSVLKLDAKGPVFDICNLLEEAGIKIYLYKSLLKKSFGMSMGEKDGGPVIAVNVSASVTIERQIFTAAHELGHLLLHKNSFQAEILEENNREEMDADKFASYFLMPPEGFKWEWGNTSGLHWLERVLHVKRIYKVSYRTVLKRLIDTGTADNTIYKKFAAEYKKNFAHDLKDHYEPDALEEPDALLKTDFMAYRLNRLVREAYEKEIITMSKAAEILQLPLIKMREIADSWSF